MKAVLKRRRVQSGFTLVELVAVIAVVGVLSATALPKLTALSGEARYTSLRAARAALMTVAVSAHGQYLVNGAATQDLEDVPLAMQNGYPAAAQALADAAGLGNDFTVYTNSAMPAANVPVPAAGSIAIVPNDVAGTPKAASCYLVYTQSVNAHTPPVVAVGGSTNADGCT